MTPYFQDENSVRYELYHTRGQQPINWLFFPGGPGADSRYLKTLIHELDIEGNVWLIDFPGNGDHLLSQQPHCPYQQWLEFIVPIISRFENPVCVGHSFGAMLPLLKPELEDYLAGFIAISSSPCPYLEASAKKAKEHGLPDLGKELALFSQDPCQENFLKVLFSFLPYHFPEESRAKGQKLFENLPFRFEPMAWWNSQMFTLPYVAKWVPQQVPMLIIGGEEDFITPISLFEDDVRFQRSNIDLVKLPHAGHFPWVEQGEKIKLLVTDFARKLKLK